MIVSQIFQTHYNHFDVAKSDWMTVKEGQFL